MCIEQTINDFGLPVNTRAMLSRLQDLLDEHATNSLGLERAKADPRVRAVLWLIMQQVFGQVAKIDMEELWTECVNSLPRSGVVGAIRDCKEVLSSVR